MSIFEYSQFEQQVQQYAHHAKSSSHKQGSIYPYVKRKGNETRLTEDLKYEYGIPGIIP